MIEWLEAWSAKLVLLEEYPLADLESAVSVVANRVRAHRTGADRWVGALRVVDDEMARGAKLVLHDHEWFVTSLEQFDWFLRVVEGDDHGGHRQALGQYGRVLAEALRRHRNDERSLEGQGGFEGPPPYGSLEKP